MTDEFFRFPHTPHLAWLGPGAPRGDKVLSQFEARSLLSAEVVAEEKVDGANLGISLGEDGHLRFQNRGRYLEAPYVGQFSRLNSWAGQHGHVMADGLGPGLILFGEWGAARHSIAYNRLPDWFLVFDVYDAAAGQFWSTSRRDALAQQLGLQIVPQLIRGRATLAALTERVLNGSSRLTDGPPEGVVVRREDHEVLQARAKLVHPRFVQAIDEHWSRRRMEWNQTSPA